MKQPIYNGANEDECEYYDVVQGEIEYNKMNKLKEKNIGILITDHNVREALEICDQAMVISNGTLIAKGDKSSLINNEIVKDVYLGNMYN